MQTRGLCRPLKIRKLPDFPAGCAAVAGLRRADHLPNFSISSSPSTNLLRGITSRFACLALAMVAASLWETKPVTRAPVRPLNSAAASMAPGRLRSTIRWVALSVASLAGSRMIFTAAGTAAAVALIFEANSRSRTRAMVREEAGGEGGSEAAAADEGEGSGESMANSY